MRAIQFMKIDYMMTRKQMYIVPICFLLSLVVGRAISEGEISLLVAFSYMLFVASTFSTAPFGYCVGKNRGFLLMLPATVRERVAGRFLYGLSFVVLLGALCAILGGVYVLLGIDIPLWVAAVGLCELAIGIFIMTAEFFFFYLFGEGKGNWQYLSNIVRVAPGMAMFFVACNWIEEIDGMQNTVAAGMGIVPEPLNGKLMQIGWAALAVALLLTVAAVVICAKVIEKRDYA